MNSVEALKAEIAEFEYSIKVRKDALALIKGGMHKTEVTEDKVSKKENKPHRKNIPISEKMIYRTDKDKKYLEGVIIDALNSVKRPKTAKWVFDNTRQKHGIQTDKGISHKMKVMADKGILNIIPAKGNKEARLFEVVDINKEPKDKYIQESKKIHIGHGTGKGHTNATLGKGI